MKKITLFLSLVAVLLVVSACQEIVISEIETLRVNNLPTAEFEAGTPIDLSDLEVTVIYSDGSPNDTLAIEDVNFYLRDGSGALIDVERDPNEAGYLTFTPEEGTYSLYVSYGGVSVTVTFDVPGSGFDLEIAMVTVGVLGTEYTIPIGDKNHPSPVDGYEAIVMGGYQMATTETTYKLWYNVREWAEENGYSFQNFGLPGSRNSDNINWSEETNYPETAPPVTEDNENLPVTMVSYYDVVVWMNALSQMAGYEPVYRTESGDIIKDSNDSYEGEIQTDHKGYRLPTNDEWEMAARWRNSGGDGFILKGERYWTPGNYASGAGLPIPTATCNVFGCTIVGQQDKIAATEAVGWYYVNLQSKVQPVSQLSSNDLSIYDMSGNVAEFVYTDNTHAYCRGGGINPINILQVGDRTVGYNRDTILNTLGFRLVKDQPEPVE